MGYESPEIQQCVSDSILTCKSYPNFFIFLILFSSMSWKKHTKRNDTLLRKKTTDCARVGMLLTFQGEQLIKTEKKIRFNAENYWELKTMKSSDYDSMVFGFFSRRHTEDFWRQPVQMVVSTLHICVPSQIGYIYTIIIILKKIKG